jgi:putative nucleotidyltransferase with HDIG domain
MRATTKFYISAILAVLALAVSQMYYASPEYSRVDVQALTLLVAVGMVSELFSYNLAREGRASVAYVSYFASIILVPSWPAVVAVTAVKWLMETLSRIDRRKAIFNAATHGLTVSVAIAIYSAFGGQSLLALSPQSLGSVAEAVGIPALLAFASGFVVNTMLVTGAIAMEKGEAYVALVKQNVASSIGADLVGSPVVFVFAWVYATFGWMAAAVSWIPFLGLRHLSQLNAELQRTNSELLQLMVKSIEARDPYTSGHSRRVSKYAVAIARLIGRSEREIADIERAALLHDVGKIYEKYGPILSSTGRLSAAEWVTMQEHPIDGANLVGTITSMRHFVPAVRHHHENWDGTGYPDRIAGDDIPLASRVIMFADTIDAMTSERPYRRPLTEADVCAELTRGRGKQFDPQITDRLLAAGVWKTLFGDAKSRGRQVLELMSSRSA